MSRIIETSLGQNGETNGLFNGHTADVGLHGRAEDVLETYAQTGEFKGVSKLGRKQKKVLSRAIVNLPAGGYQNGNGGNHEAHELSDPLDTLSDQGDVEVQGIKIQVYSPTMVTEQIDDGNRDFYTLREDKFFATQEHIVTDDPQTNAATIQGLPSEERSRVVQTLDSIKVFLGVDKLSDVSSLLKNPDLRKAAREIIYRNIGGMYQLNGSVDDIKDKVDEFAAVTNSVITRLRRNELSEYSMSVEMMNDVHSENDPLELLLMTFDNSYAPQARFEAKRKLELMMLVANIDLRERQTDVAGKISDINDFFAKYVFTPEARRGEVNAAYLVATFDPDTYEATSVHVLDRDSVDPQSKTYIDPETGEVKNLEEDQKLIRVPRRKFTVNGRDIPIYVTNDPKTRESKVLKLVRKGTLNPDQAVDDDVRMMGVLDSYVEVHDFMRHLKRSALAAGSFIHFEDYEDKILGGKRKAGSGTAVENGGDPRFKVVKFHARFGLPNGKTVNMEVMLHTKESALDYRYQEGVAHEEFKAREFFGKDDEISVGDLLFPYKFYGIDMKLAREERIETVRRQLKLESAGIA